MKKLFFFLTLSSFVFNSAASAVEYAVINFNKPIVKLDPTDIVEIVGHTHDGEGGYINFDGWGNIPLDDIYRRQFGNEIATRRPIRGTIITGATEAKIIQGGSAAVTLKITKASEINKVGPTSVLVLPENATGNYDLIVESSSDSVTWTPFHSQAVQSDTAKRLFRVRIVHKGQEEAKAKEEDK